MLTEASTCIQSTRTSKPFHASIYWIASAEYLEMSTHVLGFHSLFTFFASFCNYQISHKQLRVRIHSEVVCGTRRWLSGRFRGVDDEFNMCAVR